MEHFAVSAMASLSFLMEGLVKCRRNEKGKSSFGRLESELLDDGETLNGPYSTEPCEGVLGASNVQDRASERHREHGAFLSQAALAAKQDSQDCLFLPGLAAGGHG